MIIKTRYLSDKPGIFLERGYVLRKELDVRSRKIVVNVNISEIFRILYFVLSKIFLSFCNRQTYY
jgi:hypothetical protein